VNRNFSTFFGPTYPLLSVEQALKMVYLPIIAVFEGIYPLNPMDMVMRRYAILVSSERHFDFAI
jgi:hypothetical protein